MPYSQSRGRTNERVLHFLYQLNAAAPDWAVVEGDTIVDTRQPDRPVVVRYRWVGDTDVPFFYELEGDLKQQFEGKERQFEYRHVITNDPISPYHGFYKGMDGTWYVERVGDMMSGRDNFNPLIPLLPHKDDMHDANSDLRSRISEAPSHAQSADPIVSGVYYSGLPIKEFERMVLRLGQETTLTLLPNLILSVNKPVGEYSTPSTTGD